MHALLITAWNALVNLFFGEFTRPTAAVFARLLAGWVVCTGRRTVTGLLRGADPHGRRAHDAYHRFFPDASWSMESLWQRLTVLLVRRLCPTGRIAVDLDDTVFRHTGRKIAGAGWWRDAVRSTATHVVHAWGLNLVVLTLRVEAPWGGEPLGLPIHMRLHRKQGATLIELAREMLLQVSRWLPERRFLACADGFYATLTGTEIPRVEIVSRIRRDAVLYDLPPQRRKKMRGRPRKRGRRLGAPESMAAHARRWRTVRTRERGHKRTRHAYARTVLWYSVSHQPMLLVISRDPTGRERDDFFSSRPTGPCVRVRWSASTPADGASKIPSRTSNSSWAARSRRPARAPARNAPRR